MPCFDFFLRVDLMGFDKSIIDIIQIIGFLMRNIKKFVKNEIIFTNKIKNLS